MFVLFLFDICTIDLALVLFGRLYFCLIFLNLYFNKTKEIVSEKTQGGLHVMYIY